MQNLTQDEMKLVIEALLFTSSVQVQSDHDDKQTKQMVEIAKKLNKTANVPLNSIYFFVENEYEETYASDILNSFPEVPQVGVRELLGIKE